MKLIKSFV